MVLLGLVLFIELMQSSDIYREVYESQKKGEDLQGWNQRKKPDNPRYQT